MILNKEFGLRLSPEEREGILTGAKDPKKHRNYSESTKTQKLFRG
jgi:hypothetical protein